MTNGDLSALLAQHAKLLERRRDKEGAEAVAHLARMLAKLPKGSKVASTFKKR